MPAESPSDRTDARLTELLLRWQDADAEGRAVVEAEVREVYGEERAVFVLDMSGFSASVVKNDIIHFLARIHQMRSVVVPLVEEHGGEVVKYIGDDVLGLFQDVPHALYASRQIVALCRQPEGEGFEVSIGIGWGPILHVPRIDIWGAEVNAAFKLGEDTAGPGEILLTSAAFEVLDEEDRDEFEPMDIQIAGVTFQSYSSRL